MMSAQLPWLNTEKQQHAPDEQIRVEGGGGQRMKTEWNLDTCELWKVKADDKRRGKKRICCNVVWTCYKVG